MTDPRPQGPVYNSDRLGVVERLMAVVTSLNVQNLLMLGILVAISVPAYFAWRFMSDTGFRHEFLSTATIIEAEVPCFVVRGNIAGFGDRHTVTTSYATVGSWDYSIAIRAPSLMSNTEIKTACEIAHREVDLMQAAVRDRNARTTEGK
jgi:hypothetical protein